MVGGDFVPNNGLGHFQVAATQIYSLRTFLRDPVVLHPSPCLLEFWTLHVLSSLIAMAIDSCDFVTR